MQLLIYYSNKEFTYKDKALLQRSEEASGSDVLGGRKLAKGHI
jgi:hypothetical protein